MALIDALIADYGLLGIVIGSFLSYSFIPLPTEPILVLGAAFFDPAVVLLFSLLGATLGSILNYYIGLKGLRILFFKRSRKNERKAEKLFAKWGPLSIVLFSWLPIGDPLIVVAGIFRMNFWRMLLYATLGKLWYFIAIIWFGATFLF